MRRSTGTSDPDSWYVWADWDGPPSPGPRFLKLTRDLFVSADVIAEVTDADERSEAGVIWLLTIRQTPLVMTVEIYR